MASVEYKSNYYKNKMSGASNDVPTQTYKSNYYKNKSAQQNATQTPMQMTAPITGKVTQQQAIDMTRALVGNPAGNYNQEVKPDINKWLQKDYKLSKDELSIAKAEAKKLRAELQPMLEADVRNKTYASMDQNSALSKKWAQLIALENKTNSLASVGTGLLSSLKTMPEFIARKTGNEDIVKSYDQLNNITENNKIQNPLGHTVGYMGGKLAEYKLGADVAQVIPGLSKATQVLGHGASNATKGIVSFADDLAVNGVKGAKTASNMLKGMTSAKAMTNILGDTALDLALDTLPEILTNVQNGKTAPEVATDAVKNIAVNMGFNLGGEAIGQVLDILKTKKLDKANLRQNVQDTIEKVAKNDTQEMQAGVATKIKAPYNGATPVYNKPTNYTIPDVSADSLRAAQQEISKSQLSAEQTGKSARNFLTQFYNKIFEETGGARAVQVANTQFDNKPYIVTINKNSVGKVISDKNLTAQKLALFDVLDDVVESGQYVGSGAYVPHGSHTKQTIRFDYFETPVRIDGTDYIATFDVEVVPGKNNYRTHKVVNKIDLVPKVSGEVGPVPTAQTLGLSPTTNIPNFTENVNDSNMQNFVNKSDFGKNTVGAAEQNKNSYSHMVNEYGQFPAGEKPFREVDVPISTDGTDRVARGTRTILEAQATPEELIPEFEKAVTEGLFSYDVKTDKAAMKKAVSDITDYGFQGELSRWNKLINSGEKIGKEDMVKAQMLYTAAANSGDIETAMLLAADIAQQATNAGQTAQAMRLLKKMTPEGKLYYAQKSVDRLQKELAQKYGKEMPELVIDKSLAEGILKATDEKSTQEAVTKLYQSIADQVPATFSDRWEAWRYFAMLGNTRTQLRNVLANVVSLPLRSIKNSIQAITESSLNGILKATGNEGIERTRTLLRPRKEQINFAKNDYDIAKGLIDGGGKYRDGKAMIDQMKDPFKINGNWGKTANSNVVAKGARAVSDVAMGTVSKLNRLNNAGLELGDTLFSRGAYIDALSNYMRANGLKDSDMVGETLLKARSHAVKEAQEAVFREANSVATWLNQIENHNKLSKIIVGGVVPFKKTPLNIVKRGIEYSPAGLLKGINDVIFNVKNGNKTATEAISEISKGLTGIGGMALGYWLSRTGFIRASGADNAKEKKWDTQIGEQNYSLNIGDYSYSLDWTGAGMLPIFMGAEINKLADENGYTFNNVMTAIFRVSEPLFDTTMLQGLNSAISSAAWGSEAQLTNFGTQAIQNFVSQSVPTLFGQVARATDDTRRTTYTNKQGFESTFDKTLQQARNKLPGASQNGVPYLDVWGNEVKNTGNNFGERLAYNMLSPGYLTKKTNDPVEQKIREEFSKTKNTDFLPSNNTKTVSVGGEKVRLDTDQYLQYKQTKGQSMYQTVNKLPYGLYGKLDNERAAKAYQYVYDYATQKAKKDVFNTDMDNWITTAEEYAKKTGTDTFETVAEFAVVKAATSNVEGKKDRQGNTITGSVKQARIDAIKQLGYTTADAYKLYQLLY